jgi:cob(I)alamin adenosyltransferase
MSTPSLDIARTRKRAMRAEIIGVVDEIKQAISLLRRHL